MQKKCALCGLIKDSSEFHNNSRNKDGLHSYCKSCNALKAHNFNSTTEKGKRNVKAAQRKQYDSGYYKYGKGAIINMSQSAEKRGVNFDLTEDELKEWWEETPDVCHYCGSTIEDFIKLKEYIINYSNDNWFIYRFKKFFNLNVHANISEMTIDRVDNSKGYEVTNIKKACWICNSLKSDFFTGDEMIYIGKLIIKHLEEEIEKE